MKFCIACKFEIPNDASICLVCKIYQKKWLKWIQLTGANVALITFVFAGLVYFAKNVSNFISLWTSKDKIEIAFLNSKGETSYFNSGDCDVILMSENLSCFGMSVGRSIFKKLKKVEFVSFGSGKGYGVDRETFAKEKPNSSIEMLFFDKDNAELIQMKKAFPKLKTFSAKGNLVYYSVHD